MEAVFTTAQGREFAARVKGDPSTGTSIFGGYDQASFRCDLTPSERRVLPGSTVRLDGVHGPFWAGVPTLRPMLGDPLICQGWGFGATYGRRPAYFCHQATQEWKERTGPRTSSLAMQTDGSVIRCMLTAGSIIAAGTSNGVWIRIPTTTSSRLTFLANVTSANWEWRLYSGTYNPAAATGYEGTWSLQWTQTQLSESVDITISAAPHNMLLLLCVRTSQTTTVNESQYIDALSIYGVHGVTDATAHSIVDNILTSEIATQFLPTGDEYLSAVDACATSLAGLTFESLAAAPKLAKITELVPYDFGWYGRWVSGNRWLPLPHFTARATSPHYILDVSACRENKLREAGMEPLASVARVHYTDSAGGQMYRDVPDTDITHYLVAAGLPPKYIDLDLGKSNYTLAGLYGATAIAEAGRDQLSGSLTTEVLYRTNGAEARFGEVKSGEIVRVTGLDRDVDAVIRNTQMKAESLIELTLDNEPSALKRTLARLEMHMP